MSNVITIPRAAEALDLTPQALYLAAREGRIASRRELDRIVIPLAEFNRLKKEQKKRARKNGSNGQRRKAA